MDVLLAAQNPLEQGDARGLAALPAAGSQRNPTGHQLAEPASCPGTPTSTAGLVGVSKALPLAPWIPWGGGPFRLCSALRPLAAASAQSCTLHSPMCPAQPLAQTPSSRQTAGPQTRCIGFHWVDALTSSSSVSSVGTCRFCPGFRWF